jgi:hypothetical protein
MGTPALEDAAGRGEEFVLKGIVPQFQKVKYDA